MIPRLIQKEVVRSLKSLGKIVLLLGARQVGKTTLIKAIQADLEKQREEVFYLNCDLAEDKKALDTDSFSLLSKLVEGIDFLLVDEAQRLTNPGLVLKILHDNFRKVRVLASGSSSFDLKNKMSDPLTGRYVDFTLYPLSLSEVLTQSGGKTRGLVGRNYADNLLEEAMVYGFYPEIYLERDFKNKILFLSKIVESYLFLDILSFERVRNAQAIKDLARALAYQIGSEVNENELAGRLKIDRKTVVSYLDILEKSYVIVRLYPYSKNPRREIGKKFKVYFCDLGIRNSLIGDFNPIAIRHDSGPLWENFLLMERRKTLAALGKTVSCYFWRSYGGAEVDYIEKSGTGSFGAYEFKYGGGKLSRGSGSFASEYNLKVKLVNRENYFDFLNL